jgi:chromosome segregation ATPase
MSRSGITYTEVSNAAKQLIAAGRSPTVETVRITLGTGSNSTINTHLRDWKTRQTQAQNIATKENLPEELIATIKGLWNQVMDQSEEKILTIQQEAKQTIEKLKQEAQQLQQESGHWQQQYQQIKKERDGFAHEKSAVEQLLADAKIEAAALIEKHAGFERQNQEKQKYIDEIQRQNQQIQANLEHYRASVLEQRTTKQQGYEQQQRQFEQTIRQANQELVEVRQENTALQQQYQRANFEKDGLKIEFDKLNAQHESVATRLTEALKELAKREGTQQHWQNQCGVLTTKFDEQNKSFVELQTKHAMLIQQSETTNEEIKELRKQNSSLANEKWELGQEKARLYGQLKQIESVKLSRV